MITLASTNIQNIPVYPSATSEDTTINPDTTTGPITDSKLHSQIPVDTYVLKTYISSVIQIKITD